MLKSYVEIALKLPQLLTFNGLVPNKIELLISNPEDVTMATMYTESFLQ